MLFKIGDLVSRNSYNNDTIFKITEIDDRTIFLKGVDVRLYADSPPEDLKLEKNILEKQDDNAFIETITENLRLDRNEYFYLPGKVLHIDGDNDYLNKCMKFYKENKLKAYGVFSTEEDLIHSVEYNLEKYNPDILVITGHDAYFRKRRNDSNYKNTNKFIDAVKSARKYEHSHEKLFIIAGACQSNYEELIKAGANFASSPKRINIHALDPAIIAACLAFSDKNNNIDLIKILDKTKYGSDGIGGIITKGTMYVGYPR